MSPLSSQLFGQLISQQQLPTQAGDKRYLGNLLGSAASLAIGLIAAKHPGLLVVITPDSSSCRHLARELSFYSPTSKQWHFPDWETLVYDRQSPHEDITSARLASLFHLPLSQSGILLLPVTTLMQRLPPVDYVSANALVLNKGQPFSLDTFRQHLQQVGYRAVDTVYAHGEFAIRGSLLDIFPMGSQQPFRIDLFDEEIDSLRCFDADTQRTISQIERIELLPAKEVPLTPEGIKAFRHNWHNEFSGNPRHCTLYQDVSQGISPPGIEYYLPLFFSQTATLFDYLPASSLLISLGDCQTAGQQFWQEAQDRYEQRKVDPERPILAPENLFLRPEQLFGKLKNYPQVVLTEANQADKAGRFNLPCQPVPKCPVKAQSKQPLAALQAFLSQWSGSVLFCAESLSRQQTLLELLANISVKPALFDQLEDFIDSQKPLGMTIAPLDQGLCLSTPELAIISESQLFDEQIMQRRRRQLKASDTEEIVKDLTELSTGAPVVHIEHGIGRYLGLQNLQLDGQENEFFVLEYADQAKLYVPVQSLHLINRYSGQDPDLAPLHKLGSQHWQKAKRKAAEKINDVAAQLLDVYARRAASQGFSYQLERDEYERFAAGFSFEETPDQAQAIAAVIADMTSSKPMDRLICGDVGFGKTEVAMRAAFIAVHNNKQVAILVPTTLLAQQHYTSLKDRFANWPVNIDLLSRFRSGKQLTDTLSKVANGQVDIIIGTHKLLQASVKYHNLGLIIVDEEHRFGVQQKEKLKKWRAQVDMLALTATPIPRTLNLSLSGLRDLSIIATPPAKRLSINTFVRELNKPLIKEAILRELLRGGQVYYLYNEVKTIEQRAEQLKELVKEARLAVAHGQMRERQLERIMSDFYHNKFNVLVCSTIIENGIDIPNANTIIMERADKLGLAQLHQLRGRVGRSHHQAYAYLLTPDPKAISADGKKRLDAIASTTELGAGFNLASHDLEIRGAGELLGEEQSGQMQTLGFTLYMEMLEQAVNAIKSGETPSLELELDQGVDINLHIPALIPDDYLPDVSSRLAFYKRIASAKNNDQLDALQAEMIDRFGLLTTPSKHLFRIAQLKLTANKLGIDKIDAGDQGGYLLFKQTTPIVPTALIKLLQAQPQVLRLTAANKLKFTLDLPNAEERLQQVEKLLQHLAASTSINKGKEYV